VNGSGDNYEIYYADKLWALLPAVYRAEDTDQFDANGPLRELVNRIGAQAAIVRRSIDRLWEDQSIETCDDWVIAYIGDLLHTNLVLGLDPSRQRLDVAKTIHYRRRKGTLAILEEIAANITGWDAKVVEFFRRLGRTRHGLDPAIGRPTLPDDEIAQLQYAEGLVGRLTRTGIGGFADLRKVYGASKAQSAFDEFFHTADFRAGRGSTGWYNIPGLGVFLWRLRSFALGPATPVPVAGCHGWFTFDPTGRDVPLFAPGRSASSFGDRWVSPAEAQIPGSITQGLLDANIASTAPATRLYPNALAVFRALAADATAVPAHELLLRPGHGRFASIGSPPLAEPLVIYHYGFSSEIGAGPYDRRVGGASIATHLPATSVSGGGDVLARPGTIPGRGTLMLADSLTYAGARDISLRGDLTLIAGIQQRPLVRLNPGQVWTITGQAGVNLTLDGLFISGGDIVLRGSFATVTLNCCTLDPGSAAPAERSPFGSPPADLFAVAADGRALVPTRLWIEAAVNSFTATRCILGPLRTRSGGVVETLAISDTILQSIPTSSGGPTAASEVKDLTRLDAVLQAGDHPVAAELLHLAPGIAQLTSPPAEMGLLAALNQVIEGPSIYDRGVFRAVPLSAKTLALLAEHTPPGAHVPMLNRRLLEDAFPLELADLALGLGDGTASLTRCTLLGRIVAHRFDASECILHELAQVDDTQHGCVRFTAWADGSVLPRKYESVRIPQGAPLFTTTEFEQPGYGQLLALADAAILPGADPSGALSNTISAGAEDGSEMGAFAREKTPIKERGLLIKFQEYMPAGLVPVLIPVT
jgi:hypothetical protein